MIGTKQAAARLGLRPGTLTRAVWEGRIQPPAKGPGGAYIWTEADLRRASWTLLGRDLDDAASTRKERVDDNGA
jgi:hypothetical protein